MIKGLCFLSVAIALLSSGCEKSGGPEKPETRIDTEMATLSVTLTPERPAAGTDVKAVVSGRAGDVGFLWEVNGEEVDASGDTLGKGMFRKDDVIRVTAEAGGMEAADETVAANTPPSILSVRIRPEAFSAGTEISAEAEGHDPDNDLLRYDFVWSVNGERFYGEILPGKQVRRGQDISLRVVAFDGDDESEAFEARVISAKNSPPRFVSSPPAEFSRVFIYEVRAVDPDGDDVGFSLVKGPEGMAFKGNRLEWDVKSGEGQPEIVISVDDGNGGSSLQTFRLTIGREEQDAE
ncbi:MAG: hypothetical protein H3C68_02880 [Deltaproteobacteria bacterium]|nr:hypothetical protein [Deltaproteobacteria bacterium]MBZ0221236.1 hypothetical protein [Deltaproteobacteria bacterium]